MLLFPGTHSFRRDANPNRPCTIDYMSVSAAAPSTLKVFVNAFLVEFVYVGAYSPHTWWGNNPIVAEAQMPQPGETVIIEVGEQAICRIESNLLPDLDGKTS